MIKQMSAAFGLPWYGPWLHFWLQNPPSNFLSWKESEFIFPRASTLLVNVLHYSLMELKPSFIDIAYHITGYQTKTLPSCYEKRRKLIFQFRIHVISFAYSVPYLHVLRLQFHDLPKSINWYNSRVKVFLLLTEMCNKHHVTRWQSEIIVSIENLKFSPSLSTHF